MRVEEYVLDKVSEPVDVEMPFGARIIGTAVVDKLPRLYVLVTIEAGFVKRRFLLVKIGMETPAENYCPITQSTLVLETGVWHVFEYIGYLP